MDEQNKHVAARHADLSLRVHPDHEWRAPSGRMLMGEEPSGPPTVAIVTPGHTVDTGKGRYGPGETVECPLSEIERLRILGFLT